MFLSCGEGFAIKRKNKTIKYTTEYNLYRSNELKTVTLDNMIVVLPSPQEFI